MQHLVRESRHRVRLAALGVVVFAVAGGVVAPAEASAARRPDAFAQINLVSDLPGLAPLVDDAVKNPWGIVAGPTTPLWVNNQFGNKITVYRGANGVDPFSKVTQINVDASSPTGIVFNRTAGFSITQASPNGVSTTGPAPFIFAENAFGPGPEDVTGEVSAWRNTAPNPLPTTTVVTAKQPGAFYAGLAIVPNGWRGPALLAAGNSIDVYDSSFHLVNAPGAFVDPGLNTQFAPYNVTFLRGNVYVAYANINGPGGAVSVFSRRGRFIRQLASSDHGAPLDGPWGMAIAPKHWGQFGRALLVGNVDDGRINAFNRSTGQFLGTLADAKGDPLVNPGLWGLMFGNGVTGTPRTLLFAAGVGSEVGGAGPDVYEHGLVGMIQPVRTR